MVGGGREGEVGSGEGGGGERKKSSEKWCHSAREGLDAEEATVSEDQCAFAE